VIGVEHALLALGTGRAKFWGSRIGRRIGKSGTNDMIRTKKAKKY
jgi:hypothetical protein